MRTIILLGLAVAAVAQQRATVAIDSDDIGGVVTSSKGPEAGVWVIAETSALPKASYKLWVRGYGLIDSAKVDASPGKSVNLTATLAPDAKAAAEYYPASYWYSLL